MEAGNGNTEGWRRGTGIRSDGGREYGGMEAGNGNAAGGPRCRRRLPSQLRAMEGRESPAEPGSGPARRFPVAAVEAILRDVVGSALRERRYEPGPCREAAKDIAEAVKARVKALVVPRYKVVVVAHVGQLGGQSLQISSRCLWDPDSDTFSSYVFKNTSLFAVANVYGVYFE
ncbi:dynein light chain Tctex-type 5 [Passer montanus]|uniref:dynein light chain Tctex-type 5 n=1 Tax=Passer montanus TaxID=9160 RepID=UPI0019600358|nr:dynein light chain Tctex-type 5 [Passer montanus]